MKQVGPDGIANLSWRYLLSVNIIKVKPPSNTSLLISKKIRGVAEQRSSPELRLTNKTKMHLRQKKTQNH